MERAAATAIATPSWKAVCRNAAATPCSCAATPDKTATVVATAAEVKLAPMTMSHGRRGV